ncbi:MAG: DUF502 domain-containing protein [Bacillota bacterium]
MLKQIRNYFIAGLVALLPLWATISIIMAVVNLVEKRVGPLVKITIGYDSYGLLSLLLTFFIILAVGIVTRNVLGKKLIQWAEKFLDKIPIVRKIYFTVQQLVSGLFLRERTAFEEVVLIEFPKDKVYQIGFLTNDNTGEISHCTKFDLVNVFVPTTPNPTSGRLALVPRDKVTNLNMTVEEGLKYVVSAGTVIPKFRGEDNGNQNQTVEQ